MAFTGLTGRDALDFFSRPDTTGYWQMGEHLYCFGNFGTYSFRVPGYPALIALSLLIDPDPESAAVILVWLGILASTATTALIYLASEKFKPGSGLWAGLLAALNLTAIANAPMLLADTVFALLTAATLYIYSFFHCDRKRIYCWIAAFGLAAAATLVKPINLFWFIPFGILLLSEYNLKWKTRYILSACGLLAYLIILSPQFVRNAAIGAGWTIDTNTGAMYHQNGAMIKAELNQSSFEVEKEIILLEQERLFSDLEKFPDEASRERYRIGEYRKLILSHPLLWFKQQCNWKTLLPDVATFWENLGITTPNRGTMDILARKGVMAAARHYFGDKIHYLWFLLIPLGVALLLYLGAAVGFFSLMIKPDSGFSRIQTILLTGCFIIYYLWLPGAISVPRYQLPALPFLCVLSAYGISALFSRGDKSLRKQDLPHGKAARTAKGGLSRGGKSTSKATRGNRKRP